MEIGEAAARLETISRTYSERFGVERTDDWLVLKLGEEVGELTQAYLKLSGQGRRKGRTVDEVRDGFALELADVFAHVLLLANRHGVVLEDALEAKWLHAADDWDGRPEGLG